MDMDEFSHKRTGASMLVSNVLRLISILLLVLLPTLARPGEQTNEAIAGVTIPIPLGMTKSTDQAIELTVPGFKGGQVAYRGNLEPSDIIEFYQTNMPVNGWGPYASLVVQGGLLVYTKDNRGVLIMVGKSNGETTLAIMVGSTKP